MRRRIENVVRRAYFNDFAGIHNGDPVRHIRNYAQIVRNENYRKLSFDFDFVYEFEYLRLNGNVESRRRLVADENIGVCRKRDSYNYSLTHTARKLERILPVSLSRFGNTDFVQKF